MKSAHLSGDTATPLRPVPPLAALLAFERAATLRSFRRAAQDLALTPSAISHQIRGLEERLGVRLFVRGARRVDLTSDGESYLQAVSAALGMLDDASRDLLRRGQLARSELRVSSLPMFTSTVMLPALGELQKRQPGLTLRIEATYRYADLVDDGVDVAIRYGRVRSEGMRLEPLIEVEALPYCAPSVAAGLRVPADLAKATLIYATPDRRSWTSWLRAAGVPNLVPRHELWLDSVPAAMEAAEHGLGVSLGLHPLIGRRRGLGRTLVAPFSGPRAPGVTFYMVTRPEQARDRRIIAFRRWLLDAVKRATR